VLDAACECILAQKDPQHLEFWLERAILAESIDKVTDDSS